MSAPTRSADIERIAVVVRLQACHSQINPSRLDRVTACRDQGFSLFP
jgi:hypothetical protein